jgi:solute carrier family 25 folate transporter 32
VLIYILPKSRSAQLNEILRHACGCRASCRRRCLLQCCCIQQITVAALQNVYTPPSGPSKFLALLPSALQNPSAKASSQMPEDNLLLNGIIGAASGGAATLFTHPFDTIKTRFQANDGRGTGFAIKYNGVGDAIVKMCKAEGAGALYKGLMPNLIGSMCAWGLYMFGYNLARNTLTAETQGSTAKTHTASINFVSAAAAGVISATLTNPIWLIKTRLQLQVSGSGDKAVRYRGIMHCARCIVAEEGAAGLFRGLLPGLMLVSHGAVQFMAYEELKSLWGGSEPGSLNSGHYLIMGASSKVIASITTYPFQVIRTRLQMLQSASAARVYVGVVNTAKEVMSSEGIAGFYKGLTPNLIRVVPSSAITLAVYEGLSKLLDVKT